MEQKLFLLSTVVAPLFESGVLKMTALTTEEFLELLPQVTHNYCGHPVTSGVLREACPDLPEPVRAFWGGDGIAIAARPRGGVRASTTEGDTQVTMDDLEFVQFTFEVTE